VSNYTPYKGFLSMNEPPLSRIVVENESDWLRVKANVEGSLSGTMEARLSSLPGGKDGRASRTVQQEVEARLAKVCRNDP
jgi:hypothetical protein